MKTDGLRANAQRYIRTHALLCADDRVLIGLSGGADSVALLHFLLTLKREGRIAEVQAAHVHHGLRGEEANADAAFVKQLCSDWNVPLYITYVRVAELAAEQHKCVEEMGREVRYAYFNDVANGAKIATAHTATDNAETVLLHIARGCGLQGLCGIAPKNGNVIRPLLGCTRADVEEYCRVHALPYVTDSTNADIRYARNRVRAQVLPALRALNPSLELAVERLTQTCMQDTEYLEGQANAALTALSRDQYGRYNTAELRALPSAIRVRVWQLLIPHLCFEDSKRLDAVLFATGAVDVAGGYRVTVLKDTVEISVSVAPSADVPRPLCAGERYTWGNALYHYRVISRAEMEKLKFVHKNVVYYAVDYDTIDSNPCVTARKEGDGFRPAGRGMYKTLKKFLNEQRIPASQRDSIPILRDDTGIFLLAGLACDERTAITDNTVRIAVFLPITQEGMDKDEQYT